jgi:TonB family protein
VFLSQCIVAVVITACPSRCHDRSTRPAAILSFGLLVERLTKRSRVAWLPNIWKGELLSSTAVITVSGRKRPRDWVSEGWWTSLLAHVVLLYAALLLPKHIHFSPPEPFRWEISLVSSMEGESPIASLTDKAAPSVASQDEPPPVVTSTSPSANMTIPQAPARGVTESVTAGHADGQRAPRPVPVETGERLYQVVGPDGSVSFTNVPSDSRSREKHFAPGLLSTVDSSSAFKSDTNGLSARPPTVGAKSDTAWVWQTILRRLVVESNSVCYPVISVAGRVVLKVLIDANGYMSNFQVVQSSGYNDLDQNTFDILRHINPVTLPRPLGQPSMWLQFPMTYRPNSPRPTGCARVNG